MTVREMLSRIDAHELTEWLAYYRIEPFGESVADQRHGIACALLANVNRDAKKHPDAFQPNDFVYWHESHSDTAPILLTDPVEQSNLIKRHMAGLARK